MNPCQQAIFRGLDSNQLAEHQGVLRCDNPVRVLRTVRVVSPWFRGGRFAWVYCNAERGACLSQRDRLHLALHLALQLNLNLNLNRRGVFFPLSIGCLRFRPEKRGDGVLAPDLQGQRVSAVEDAFFGWFPQSSQRRGHPIRSRHKDHLTRRSEANPGPQPSRTSMVSILIRQCRMLLPP
jgi:hypothetical protein